MYSEVVTHYVAGGWMIWPMVAITPILWYALGYRYVVINKGFSKHNIRTVMRDFDKNKEKNKEKIRANSNASSKVNEEPIKKSKVKFKSMIHVAVDHAKSLQHLNVVPIRPHLDEAFAEYITEMNKYGTVIRTIVYVAPLMGLLGTVTGMIETFDSLQDMTLHSASGGIAGGISQALITTQLGLTIAIPGLLINVYLDKRKERIERELNQLKDIICSQAVSKKI